MTKHLKIGNLHFYVADHKMKKPSSGTRNKAQKRLKQFAVAKAIAERDQYSCELCGCGDDTLQMHHLLAQSLYPEKALEPANIMLVCNQCHQRIHNDPFLWVDLIRQRIPNAAAKVDAIMAQPPYKSEVSIKINL